ncbi:phospholipid phosphatase 1, partial [Ixodes scapularis]
MHSRSCSLRRVLTYVWILALLLLCVASIRGAFLPSKLPGFRCDDPDIRHPFRGDTVTLGQILLLVVVVPGPLLALVEWWANPCGPLDWGVVGSAFRHYVIGLELVSVSVEVVKTL